MKLAVGAVSLGMVAAACGSSGKTSSPTTTGGGSTATTAPSQTIPNQILADNNSGTPVTGGTLTMLGTGDVDYMDPNISYYTVGYLALREWSRQLYNYPAVEGQQTDAVPDLATAQPVISDGGLKYSVTIRTGAMWNTTPPRQVSGADVIRGLERSCNPTAPFGGQPDFSDILAGYAAFCTAFGSVSATSASAQAAFINSKASMITGAVVDPSNPLTVDFTLTKPSTYFSDILALPPFAPAPVEYLQYLPGSNQLAQHTISDGPYMIQSYTPATSITFVRNPSWNASTDPIRKAYVDKITVSETGTESEIYQEVLTNTPSADMQWDAGVPPSAVPGLVASKNPDYFQESEYGSNPYIVFNTVSPNNGGALAKAAVRQALSYAIDRTALIQDAGGPNVAPPLTQVLPPGINGSSPTESYYAYNPATAKSMLASAGVSNLTIKLLYRPASTVLTAMYQTIQSELGAVGVKVTGVGVPNADFYTKYLEAPKTSADTGAWDIALTGWGPDWYGDAAKSFFEPLFDGRILPPTSSNFGLFNDPTLTPMIDAALSATTSAQAATLWHAADVEVMKQAAIFPITDPNDALVHGSQVHNCIYVPDFDQCDPTNIWLS